MYVLDIVGIEEVACWFVTWSSPGGVKDGLEEE